MAPELACRKGIVYHERRAIERGWDIPETSTLEDVIFGGCASDFVCDFSQARVGWISPDFSLWTQRGTLRKLVLELSKEVAARANIPTPVLNPALQSALATLSKANDLTASELVALNDAIGGASIQNKFDIEAFYAKEDELSR